MEIHVVALEASSPLANYPKSQASGLLIWSAAGFPLILTTCLIKPGSSLRVALPGARSAERVVVEADLKASTRIRQACEAFRSLESRGWRCGEQTDGLHLHLLRPSTGCLKPSCGLPGCFSDPCERWISREIKLLFCPFGARTLRAGARPSAWSVVTRGVISNISAQPGLLLTDAMAEGAVGGALLLETSAQVEVVGIMAPALRSRSGDSVALGLAIPLSVVRDTLLDDPACQAQLLDGEAASLVPRQISIRPSWQLEQVRQGVALLWLDSGSWASAVVLSADGHLLTCAHLLTGTSWMEPSQDGSSRSSSMRFPRCHGRCFVREQGRTVAVTFEADVLHVFDGFLDAALLVAKPAGSQPRYAFNASLWKQQRASSLELGIKVWAVGHGLFGPGSPWMGPAVTCGQLARIVWGKKGRTAVLQSSAAVHRGCSGGALVAAATGELLGMVTTNAKKQDGAVLPHINFILPVSLLAPLSKYLDTSRAPNALDNLIEELQAAAADPEEQGFWRLEPEHLNLPSRLAARKQHVLESLDELEKLVGREVPEEKEPSQQSKL